VTGQGNIRASFVHGQFVAKHLIENYLGVGESRDISVAQSPAVAKGEKGAAQVEQHLKRVAPLAAEKAKELLGRVQRRQREVGMEGGYKTWIQKNTPTDLE
jgi:hypothetical protein